MRVKLLSLLLILGLASVSVRAEIFRWVDAEGRTVYGDNPPEKSASKPVNLPLLTVADGPAPKPSQAKSNTAQSEGKKAGEETEAYSDFKITSPTVEEAIRANEGTLAVSVSLKPHLKPGDGVTLYLDSKQVATGASLSFNLTDVERGEHSVFAVLNDASGNIIQNTEPVKFSVLRFSVAQGQ